nr:MAG TPA: hypothetical protein [Caudoviricetes sp.]
MFVISVSVQSDRIKLTLHSHLAYIRRTFLRIYV